MWPRYSEVMDYELEFGIVTRRTRANIPLGEAGGHIFGYTIFNDFSARDRQALEMQGRLGPAKGKSFDGGNVLGPCIVTPDEIGDPQALRVAVRVNGETRASADTSGMLFSFEEILAYASQDETIHAGEFFGSGTVGGCCGLEIGRFLESGDAIELEVEKIGVLRNKVRAPGPALNKRDAGRGRNKNDASSDRHFRAAAKRRRRPIRRATDPKIEYIDHQQSLPQILPFFPGLKAEDLPDGQGWAVERVQLSTHNGTHLDAPWHFHPTMNEGERAWTIDEVPLEWCFQSGVKLDFRRFPDGYVATAADVEAELKRIGHTLKPLDIVLVNTSAGAKYGRPDYVASGCGMGAEATLYLLERGVRLTGIDGWSWDAPFVHTAKRYAQTHDASLIWEGHKAGRHIGYCHIEKLHNLEALPSTGFTVSCFPVKIERASAGWTRAVAIIED